MIQERRSESVRVELELGERLGDVEHVREKRTRAGQPPLLVQRRREIERALEQRMLRPGCGSEARTPGVERRGLGLDELEVGTGDHENLAKAAKIQQPRDTRTTA